MAGEEEAPHDAQHGTGRTLRVIGAFVLAALALGGALAIGALHPGVPFGEKKFDATGWTTGGARG